MWWAPLLQVPMWLLMILRGNWTPRFPRAWRGRRVTVCSGRRVFREKMERISFDSFALWSLQWIDGVPVPPPRQFFFKDEGITWCTGWSGKNVDALRVAAALTVLES